MANEFGKSPGTQGAWTREVSSVAEAVSDAGGVNQLVERLRVTRYKRICRDHEPLLVADRLYQTTALSNLTTDARLRPYFLPTAMINDRFTAYNGSLNNFSVTLHPAEEVVIASELGHGVGLASQYVDPETVTGFSVKYDLIGSDGQFDGTANQRFVLYLNPADFQPYGKVRPFVRKLVKQAEDLYSPEEINNNRLLWLNSELLNGRDVMEMVATSMARHKETVARGRVIEAKNVSRPLQGGLPGRGKKSK